MTDKLQWNQVESNLTSHNTRHILDEIQPSLTCAGNTIDRSLWELISFSALHTIALQFFKQSHFTRRTGVNRKINRGEWSMATMISLVRILCGDISYTSSNECISILHFCGTIICQHIVLNSYKNGSLFFISFHAECNNTFFWQCFFSLINSSPSCLSLYLRSHSIRRSAPHSSSGTLFNKGYVRTSSSSSSSLIQFTLLILILNF